MENFFQIIFKGNCENAILRDREMKRVIPSKSQINDIKKPKIQFPHVLPNEFFVLAQKIVFPQKSLGSCITCYPKNLKGETINIFIYPLTQTKVDPIQSNLFTNHLQQCKEDVLASIKYDQYSNVLWKNDQVVKVNAVTWIYSDFLIRLKNDNSKDNPGELLQSFIFLTILNRTHFMKVRISFSVLPQENFEKKVQFKDLAIQELSKSIYSKKQNFVSLSKPKVTRKVMENKNTNHVMLPNSNPINKS